ncbi:MAG TPA: formylglycine-generating enzyme family protein [Paludibacteraceae bacterium]|nr:formylglycine-generating enzyme family protein [Paludibacteraceae bacterium]
MTILAAVAISSSAMAQMYVWKNGVTTHEIPVADVDSITFVNKTTTYTVNGVSFKMLPVAGGTFQMGAQSTDPNGQNYDAEANSYENPVHQVTLSAFTIGETEVTQALWEAVMGSNPSYFKDPVLPVEQVSWDDCQTFLTKLNQLTGKTFRLPTEAEWEYAARGGNESPGYKYSGSNTIGNVAWYYDNGGSKTHAVGTKQANELGIYDMSGNVWEWCSDWYDSYGSSSQTNPTGAASGSYRVLRGGSWNYNAMFCRVSLRSGYYPDYGNDGRGLRLVF